MFPSAATKRRAAVGLVERFLTGDPRALARLATLVEAGDPVGEAALARLYPRTGKAHVVGITGPPGAGKSTLVDALIGATRVNGRRVGVVAVDPSSPVSGGAVLGDRIRMMGRHADAGVFIRSMAARGRLGGLAAATAGIVHLLDAAGFGMIVVETVGTGQDGVEIASIVHTAVVLQVPGLGDGVQALKAGLLEVGDIVVVNKADRPEADELVRQLRGSIGSSRAMESGWATPVLATVASTGEGVEALLERINGHLIHLRECGEMAERTRMRARGEIIGRLRDGLERRLLFAPDEVPALRHAVEEVAARRAAPGEVVAELLTRLGAR